MKQDQKSNLLKGLKSSSGGQAVVEYILLMIIIVGLVMAAGKVFKGMNEGMQRYVGDYFTCLMEYGELPTLGITENDLKKHTTGPGKTCDSKFAAFTIEGGRPPTEGSGAKTGSNRSTSQNSFSKSSDEDGSGNGSSSSDGANAKKDDDSTNGEQSGTDALRGGTSRGRAAKARPGVSSGAYGTIDGESAGDDSKVRIIEDQEGNSESKRRRNQRRPRITRQPSRPEAYRPVSGRMAQELQKNQIRRLPQKPITTIRSAGEEPSGPLRRPASIRPPTMNDQTAQKKDDDSGFAFSGFLRLILIVAMILAIVVFFGGQLLNYSNSD